MKKLAAALFFFLFSCTSTSTTNLDNGLPDKKGFLKIHSEASFIICDGNRCEPSRTSAMTGSGFVIGMRAGDAIGLTAGHLCELPEPEQGTVVKQTIRVSLWGGATYQASILHIMSEVDVCVLKIAGVKLTPLKIASAPPKYGDVAYTLSAPLGIWGPDMVLAFKGFYSGQSDKVLIYDALDAYTIPTKGGSSGSPIVNGKGEVIGMTILTMRGLENFCLSPPFSAIQAISASALGK